MQDWRGDSIPVRTFEDALDIACLIGGVNPAADENAFFSEAHYRHLAATHPDLVAMLGDEAHRLRRLDHRPHPAGHGLGQDPAGGCLRQDRQA